jgi:hypothetical protein
MKKKVILALTACLLAAGSFINMQMGQNVHSMNFSMDDFAAMAQADAEDPGGGATCYWTWKGTWVGGWHIIDCYSCSQVRVKEFRDRGNC